MTPGVGAPLVGALAKAGATCRMKAFIPHCTGEVGPTSERET